VEFAQQFKEFVVLSERELWMSIVRAIATPMPLF
jgi:hypothetical protein